MPAGYRGSNLVNQTAIFLALIRVLDGGAAGRLVQRIAALLNEPEKL